MLLQYRQNPLEIFNNSNNIHAIRLYNSGRDAIESIIAIIELYKNDSILIFCGANQTVRYVREEIASHYWNQSALERSFGVEKYEVNSNEINFSLYALGSDTLSDRSSYTSMQSKSLGYGNGINIRPMGNRRLDMNQLTNNLDKKRKVMVATNVYNDGINVHAPIIIHYGLNLGSFNGVWGYNPNRGARNDRGFVKNSRNNTGGVGGGDGIGTHRYNNQIENRYEYGYENGYERKNSGGFKSRQEIGKLTLQVASNTRYGDYMRRIGRLNYSNGLSINFVKDVTYEKDAFREMMQYYKLKYVNLDQIIEKRQNSENERRKKWSVDELDGYN